MVKVSVVVPVYKPGRYLEECVGSLLAQSMPTEEYELIFVDDGSPDDAPARLDRLAVEHRHVRVHHQENSGWPGKPRNVGVDMARGTFVQFVDQDDQLGPEALERMYAIGLRNGADIVLGKVAGTNGGPSSVFRQNIDRCTIDDWPLIESVSPHKMFRRRFLLDHDIRFPEGRRRLEDQLFMVQAYLKATTVSIVGDYVCYYWNRRDDGGNASGISTGMRGYYDNLREVLDAIDAETERGERRYRLMRRFFRVEMMKRVSEPKVLRYSDGYRKRGYEVVRELAMERFSFDGAGFATGPVVGGLTPVMRLRAMLLERDRLDGLMELARRCATIRARGRAEQLQWESDRMRLEIRAHLVHADGSPLVVRLDQGRYMLDPVLTDELPTIDGWDVGDPCAHVKAELRARHRDTGTWWFVPATLQASLVPVGALPHHQFQVVVAGTAHVDVHTLAGGASAAPGRYDLTISVQTLGLGRGAWLEVNQLPKPALVGDPPRIIVAQRTAPWGHLTLHVDERRPSLAPELATRGIGPVDIHGDDLHVALPIHTIRHTAAREVEVVLGPASTPAQPARLQPGHHDKVCLVISRATTLPAGRHPIGLRTDPSNDRPPIHIGTVTVANNRIVDIRRIRHHALPQRIATKIISSPGLQRHAHRALAAMPHSTATKARGIARKLMGVSGVSGVSDGLRK